MKKCIFRQDRRTPALSSNGYVIRKTLVLCCVLLLFIGVALLRPFLTSATTSLDKQSRELIAKAGGYDKVCDEADKAFARFGTDRLKIFKPKDLLEFPTLSRLGIVDGIWPGFPPKIKVRAGAEPKHYIILIFSTNSLSNAGRPTNNVISSW